MKKIEIIKGVRLHPAEYPNVIKELSFKVFSDKSKFIDEEIFVMLNDKPPRMKQENWYKMLRKVLKIGFVPKNL